MTGHADVTTDETIAGPHGPVPVRRYAPAGAGAPGAAPIVWVHGGAFVRGTLDQPETHDVALALAGAGYPVVTAGYRLTTRSPFALPQALAGVRFPARSPARPAVRYPVPVDDVLAVVRQVQREYPGGVILGGASAGACLAAAAALRLAAAGDPAPLGMFFAYGSFHAALPATAPEVRGRTGGARRFVHTPALIGLLNLHYAGTRARMAEPFAFPGGHPVRGFPPALFLDADHDVMRASGGAFARELADAGIPVDYHVLAGTAHAFLNRPSDPGFAAGIRLVTDWAGRL
jgi:acetyl esterase